MEPMPPPGSDPNNPNGKNIPCVTAPKPAKKKAANESRPVVDLKLIGSYLWAKAKEDAEILTVGLALAAGLFHAGIALDSLVKTQDEQGKRLEAVTNTLSLHGATLNADHDILTVLCVQFRCYVSDPATHPTPPLDPGTAKSDAPKPQSKTTPQSGVLAEKKTSPISDIYRPLW